VFQESKKEKKKIGIHLDKTQQISRRISIVSGNGKNVTHVLVWKFGSQTKVFLYLLPLLAIQQKNKINLTQLVFIFEGIIEASVKNLP